MDLVIAATGDDASNVLACAYAAAEGDAFTVAVLHRLSLLPLVRQFGIDAALVPAEVRILDVFVTVTMAWVVLAVVGAVPYLATGRLTAFDLALFESISGFTTTGATVLRRSPTRRRGS
jgi:Trk-type K+ transport system membrane component